MSNIIDRIISESIHKYVNMLVESKQYNNPRPLNEKWNGNGRTFDVILQYDNPVSFANATPSVHVSRDRLERDAKIRRQLGGFGEPLYSFLVNTGHRNGPECHTITSNGVIIIQNDDTDLLCTFFTGTPNQVKRYWQLLYEPYPKDKTFNNLMNRVWENYENYLAEKDKKKGDGDDGGNNVAS